MKTAVLVLCFVSLMLLIESVSAEYVEPTTNLSWQPPTAWVDGTALDPVTDIESYTLVCEGAADVEHSIPGLTATGEYDVPYEDVFPGYGEYTCRLNAVDTNGLPSVLSAESVSIDWPAPAPRAPTQFMRLSESE